MLQKHFIFPFSPYSFERMHEPVILHLTLQFELQFYIVRNIKLTTCRDRPSLFFLIQSLVQNSRKAGITSALTSSTLHNEELVGSFPIKYDIVSCFALKITTTHSSPLLCPCRSLTCTKRPSRHSYTLFHAQPRTISRCGQPQRLLTAMSVRDFCGVLLARACAVLSVVSNAMRSAKIYSMLTVFRVSYP